MNQSIQKKLLFAFGVLSVVLLIAVIVLASILGVKNSKKTSQSEKTSEKICTTKACIDAASMILNNIDQTVDPCEDFSQFACGTFIKTQRIPDNQLKYDYLDILRNKLINAVSGLLEEPHNSQDINSTRNAKNLYKSCVNEVNMELNGETNFKDFLVKTYKGWPLLGDWSEDEFDPLETLILSRSLETVQFVDVYVSRNPIDLIRSIMNVRQPTWFFPRQYYENDKNIDVIEAYKNYMFTFAKYLGSTLDDGEIEAQVNEIYDMEKQLALLTLTEEEKRNSTNKNMTLQQLIVELPEFKWKEFIDGMFKNVENVTIDMNETILVDEWIYYTRAVKLYHQFENTKKRGLKNLLVWVFAKDRTDALPKRFKEARQKFDMVYGRTNTIQSKEITCTNLVLERMEYAAGRLYVEQYFNEASKKGVTEMFDYIFDEFRKIVNKLDWMDENTKKLTLEKTKYAQRNIGYPEFIIDEKEINEFYKDYQFVENDYFGNTIKYQILSVKNSLEALRYVKKRTDWLNGPAVVITFYSQILNQICFPAGMLVSPYYDVQAPNYLNYGGIGGVIGHEVIHGFDDVGQIFDKYGAYSPGYTSGYWETETMKKYKEKGQCIVDQYNKYYVKEIDKYVDGSQTRGENINDNGGLKEAFYAYQSWVKNNEPEPLLPGLNFTQNQLFFINFAQVWCSKFSNQALIQRVLTGIHSPNEFRIRGTTSNFDEFAKAFNCKKNSGNNPDNKCSVW